MTDWYVMVTDQPQRQTPTVELTVEQVEAIADYVGDEVTQD